MTRVGKSLGAALGSANGCELGCFEGAPKGAVDGFAEGAFVGVDEGFDVGFEDGAFVGTGETVGALLGWFGQFLQMILHSSATVPVNVENLHLIFVDFAATHAHRFGKSPLGSLTVNFPGLSAQMKLGFAVGLAEGAFDGTLDFDGLADGALVGVFVGPSVGFRVGVFVGSLLNVGAALGAFRHYANSHRIKNGN